MKAVAEHQPALLFLDVQMPKLSGFDVPAGRIMTPAALLADQEMRAIGFVETVADGLGTTIDTPSNPMGFSHAGIGIPRLNEHGGQILSEIGMVP